MTRNDLGAGGALALAAATLLLAACSAEDPGTLDGGPRPEAAAGAASALPEGHPPLTGSAPVAPSSALTGTVVETMDVAGYTYALLDLGGRQVWTAGPVTSLSEGETVAATDPMEMRGFESGALGRTFDVIYFTGTFLKGAAAPSPGAGAQVPGHPAAPSTGTVVTAIPAAGYTYVEVKTGEGTRWLAGPATPLEAGAVVSWAGGSVMRDFESRALDRTFEEILFVDRLEVVARGG